MCVMYSVGGHGFTRQIKDVLTSELQQFILPGRGILQFGTITVVFLYGSGTEKDL